MIKKYMLVVLSLLLLGVGNNIEKESDSERVKRIYKNIVRASGAANWGCPIYVEKDYQVNAYSDGRKIVIYSGLIEKFNDDELALVIAHELGHHLLWHASFQNLKDTDVQFLESNADKYGAFLTIKAGYNICKARQFFKLLQNESGDVVGASHPDFAYRYEQLNIGCE